MRGAMRRNHQKNQRKNTNRLNQEIDDPVLQNTFDNTDDTSNRAEPTSTTILDTNIGEEPTDPLNTSNTMVNHKDCETACSTNIEPLIDTINIALYSKAFYENTNDLHSVPEQSPSQRVTLDNNTKTHDI